MRPSLALLSSSNMARLTLFTRSPCGLCDTAKHTMTLLRNKQEKQLKEGTTTSECGTQSAAKSESSSTTSSIPIEKFTYSEINITDPGQQQWRDCYEFDVPVLHVDGKEKQKKLFHRWSEEDVLQAMRDVKEWKRRYQELFISCILYVYKIKKKIKSFNLICHATSTATADRRNPRIAIIWRLGKRTTQFLSEAGNGGKPKEETSLG